MHSTATLLAVAAASAVTATAAAALILSFADQKTKDSKPIHQSDSTLHSNGEVTQASATSRASLDAPITLNDEEEVLVQEQLARNIAFLGEEAVRKVRKSFVVVVGLGGVGSHAAVMLARNGVQRIRLIDFDQVTLSSLNRHAAATRADVGRPKVEAVARLIQSVTPFVSVDARVVLFNEDNAQECFEGNPDFVLDCIDNIPTKVSLLHYCKSNNIPVMCSMGAGAKGDPSRIQISDIADTVSDHLSRAVRAKLKRVGIHSGIPVVFSTEVSKVNLIPLEQEQFEQLQDYQILPDFRVRILPVLGIIPAMFGDAMAAYVLQHLAGAPLEPLHMKGRTHLYDKLLSKFRMRERDVYHGEPNNVPLDIPDVQLLMEEVWRARSAVSGTFDHLMLVRWDKSKPSTMDNIVPMTVTEAKQHEATTTPQSLWGTEVCDRIQRKLDRDARGLSQLLK